ncbi:MAG TPA: 4-hydroxythreonine-4-phosphate dehydrogenase PdxA [Alphaproteobacteria bacterium]|nr:4-hydroxythreonine-4-phosphate dehydrogenase PdxA [Alphaproteobacteria bacterium]
MIGAFFTPRSLLDHPLAVSMGEPAGIGMECALKAWSARKSLALQPFFLLADPAHVREQARLLNMNVPLREITRPQEALSLFGKALPVMPIPLHAAAKPGSPDPANAGAVIESIRKATQLTQLGEAAALVTLPIQKSSLYHSGFRFPGHTEYLADLCNVSDTVMMLEVPGLRVTLSTVHLSLKEAVAKLSTDLIVKKAMISGRALQQAFNIPSPRVAVAGLNPHAGEEGAMGLEEIEIIIPAIEQLRAQGINATGPHAPDTLFHAGMRQTYDCAHCHYHDQGLIPVKTLDFYGGVNITLGLPILRTSPDHGTALNIAGQNKANPASVIAALKRAAQLAQNAA